MSVNVYWVCADETKLLILFQVPLTRQLNLQVSSLAVPVGRWMLPLLTTGPCLQPHPLLMLNQTLNSSSTMSQRSAAHTHTHTLLTRARQYSQLLILSWRLMSYFSHESFLLSIVGHRFRKYNLNSTNITKQTQLSLRLVIFTERRASTISWSDGWWGLSPLST